MITPDLALANISAARARNVRAEWLTSLQFGLCSFTDIVAHACEPDGRPLLRLGIVRLLAEQDGWSRQRALATVDQTLRLLGQKQMPVRTALKLNVQWLVDARSGGRRQVALADAMDPKDQQPWPGFPYAAPSREAQQ